MDRMFAQHIVRKTFSLDGPWDHYFPREGTEIEPAAWAGGERRVMDVPCVWEMLDERKNYRGQAVARRTVSVPGTGWLRLVFKGAVNERRQRKLVFDVIKRQFRSHPGVPRCQ